MAKANSGPAYEKEFVSGFPAIICDETPSNKYLCCYCHNVLRRARQTLCGHRYCSPCLAWIIRNQNSPICPKCQEEDPKSLNEDSYLAEGTAFIDTAINKEIAELRVHCVTSGCHWTGHLADYEKHLCEHCSPEDSTHKQTDPSQGGKMHNPGIGEEKCSFSSLGCSYKGSRDQIKEHERCSAAMHLSLVVPVLLHLKDSQTAATGATHTIFPNLYNGQVNGDIGTESQTDLITRVALLETRTRVSENLISILDREMDSAHAKMATALEQKSQEEQKVKACEQEISSLRCALAKKEVAFNELNTRMVFLEQTTFNGVFVWKISNFTQKCRDAISGQATSLYSPAFYTARYGYKVCLRIYLNGDGAGKGTHISLFFTIMKGDYDALLPWPFRHKVTFLLLDHSNREHTFDAFRPDILSASFQRPVSDMNVASGCPLFCPLSKLQAARNNYVKDDTIFIRCIIDTNS